MRCGGCGIAATSCSPKAERFARETIRQIVHLPAEIEPLARLLPQDVLPVHDPRQITGCIVSSLLSTRDANLKPTVGLVDVDLAAKHLDALTELGLYGRPIAL